MSCGSGASSAGLFFGVLFSSGPALLEDALIGLAGPLASGAEVGFGKVELEAAGA